MVENDDQELFEPIGKRFLESVGALGDDASRLTDELEEPTEEMEAADSPAHINDQLNEDLGDHIDGELLNTNSDQLAHELERIPSLTDGDLTDDLEQEFEAIARPAWEITSHLSSIDFFETARETLPPFDRTFIVDCSVQVLDSLYIQQRDQRLENILEEAGVESDFSTWVVEVMRRSDEIETNLRIEAETHKISPMTLRGSTEGAVLWIEDLGRHLWMSEVILSDELVDRGALHARAMGTGIMLTAQGVAEIGDDATPEDAIAKIAAGFALTHLHELDLPYNVYWITDEMRAPAAWAA